jgi:hypothetical protein
LSASRTPQELAIDLEFRKWFELTTWLTPTLRSTKSNESPFPCRLGRLMS